MKEAKTTRKCFACKSPLIYVIFVSTTVKRDKLTEERCEELWNYPHLEFVCCSCLKTKVNIYEERLIEITTMQLSNIERIVLDQIIKTDNLDINELYGIYYYSKNDEVIIFDILNDVNVINRYALIPLSQSQLGFLHETILKDFLKYKNHRVLKLEPFIIP